MESGERNILINITSSAIVKTILFLVLFYVLYQLRDLILVIITAVVIASSAEPAVKWLAKYKISRVPAVLVVYIALALIFVGSFFLLIQPLFTETATFLSHIPQYIDTLDSWAPLKTSGFFSSDNQTVVQALSKGLSIKDVVLQLSGSFSNSSEGIIRVLTTVFGGLFSFILIIVISLYLAVQEDGVGKFLKIVTPLKYRKYTLHLWERSQRKIGLWMQGQLLLSVFIGILVYLGLMIFGVKDALLLAVLAGIFELIPLFGPVLSAIPGVAIALTSGGITLGLLVTGMYIIVQQFENHLIYPLVVKKVVGIPALVVIISLVVGFKLAGFLGALLSAPLAAIFMEFINDMQRDRIEENKVTPNTPTTA